MKTLLILVALIGLSSMAQATGGIVAAPVRVIVPNGFSCSSTTFLSGSSTELTSNTTAPTSVPVYEIQVMPLSTSVTTYFSDSVSVSSFGATIGVPVYPFIGNGIAQPGFVNFAISPTQKWYGTGGGASGGPAMICKKK